MDYKRSHSLSSCSSNNSNLPNGNLLSITNGSNSSTNSTNELSNSISSNNLSFSLLNQSHVKSPNLTLAPNYETNQTNADLILLSNSQFHNAAAAAAGNNADNDEQMANNFVVEHELNGHHPLYPHPLQPQHIPTTQIIAHPTNQQIIHDAQLNNAVFNSNHYLNNNCTIYELSNVN